MCLVVPGRPAYRRGEVIDAVVTCRRDDLRIRLCSADGCREHGLEAAGQLTPSLLVYARRPGRLKIELLSGLSVLDSAEVLVLGEGDGPIGFVTVFHNHQPVGELPSGLYRRYWHILHVVRDEVGIAGAGGVYKLHLLEHVRHPRVRVGEHLSPSLLAGWARLVEDGYAFTEDGELLSGDVVGAVEEVLRGFSSLAVEGVIEVLTSPWAHPIQGFIVRRFGMVDVVEEELAIGLRITREVMHTDPSGVWTPEMSFVNELADIYSSLGLKYTVLDARHHMPSGASMHRAYILRRRSEISLLFRDPDLSNSLSFNNNHATAESAVRAVYEMLLKALETAILSRVEEPIVTAALDGENWILFSEYPRNAAVMLDAYYTYLEKMQDAGIIETMFPRDAASMAEEVISCVRETSWLGSYRKWCGEVGGQCELWSRVGDVYRALRESEASGRLSEERVRAARIGLHHALDSDYWWAEFWDPDYVRRWLDFVLAVLGLRKDSL